jgi:hypothetical protein
MSWEGLFIAEERLRPIWRFFLSIVLLFVAFVIAREVLEAILLIGKFHPNDWVAGFWQSLFTLAAIIGAFKILTAVFDRRPLGSVGLAFHPRAGRELGRGLAVGSAMLLFAVALEWAGGFAEFTFAPHPVWRAGTFSFLLFTVAAINEEAIFRGYPFQRLVESITPAGAIAATSFLFGLAHLGNPHRTWISTLNTALVGVPFAIAYLRTRSLWMPIGMHFIWNFLMGFFLGLPVSGLTISASVLTARVGGPIWLTGGQYGPEGGLPTMGVILIATVYLSLTKSIYTSEDMKTLIFAPVKSKWPDAPVTIFSSPPEDEIRRD